MTQKENPRRQKAYELLHAFCKMMVFVDESSYKGPYGESHITLRQPKFTEKQLIEQYGFDKELIEFLKSKVEVTK